MDDAVKQKLQVLLYFYRERCNDSRLKASQYGLLWLNFVLVSGGLVGFGMQQRWMPFLQEVAQDQSGASRGFLILCAVIVGVAFALFSFSHLSHYAILLSLNRLEKRIWELTDDFKEIQNEAWFYTYREAWVSPVRTLKRVGVNGTSGVLVVLALASIGFMIYIALGLYSSFGKDGGAILAIASVLAPVVSLLWIIHRRSKIYDAMWATEIAKS